MGEAKNSRVLDPFNEKDQKLISVLGKRALNNIIKRWKISSEGYSEPDVYTVGTELEFALVDNKYHQFLRKYPTIFGKEKRARAETHHGLAELITKKVFTLGEPFLELFNSIKETYNLGYQLADAKKARIALIGGHANHDGTWIDGHRYEGMRDNTDKWKLNQFTLDLGNNFFYHLKGLSECSFGIHTSPNVAVPYTSFEYFFDAMGFVSVLLLGASASSPMIDNTIAYNKDGSHFHSLRPFVMMPAMRGNVFFDIKDFKLCRMDAFPFPLSTKEFDSKLINVRVYESCLERGLREPLARYIAHNWKYPIHLAFKEDKDNTDGVFPYTWWLTGKAKYNSFVPDHPSHGKMILLEFRALESMGSPQANASLVAASIAITNVVAREYKRKKLKPLEGWQNQYNLLEIGKYGPHAKVYVSTEDGTEKKMDVSEAIKGFGGKTIRFLKDQGYKEKEIKGALDLALAPYGLTVKDGQFKPCKRKLNVAEKMVKIALQEGALPGQKMSKETIQKVLSPFVLNCRS